MHRRAEVVRDVIEPGQLVSFNPLDRLSQETERRETVLTPLGGSMVAGTAGVVPGPVVGALFLAVWVFWDRQSMSGERPLWHCLIQTKICHGPNGNGTLDSVTIFRGRWSKEKVISSMSCTRI